MGLRPLQLERFPDLLYIKVDGDTRCESEVLGSYGLPFEKCDTLTCSRRFVVPPRVRVCLSLFLGGVARFSGIRQKPMLWSVSLSWNGGSPSFPETSLANRLRAPAMHAFRCCTSFMEVPDEVEFWDAGKKGEDAHSLHSIPMES